MQATGFKTAWDHPATRRAWLRTSLFRVVSLLLWLAALPGWLFAVLSTPVWALWLWIPVLFVILYVNLLAIAGVVTLAGLRRVLRHYPWQIHHGAAQPAKNGTTRFVFPDPERPERTVTLKHGDFLGSGPTFWVRQVKAGRVDEVWFAGDPRFIGVVAVPGPRRLRRCAQPEAVDRTMSARKRGVSSDALDRARAVGARTGKDHDQ